MGRFADRIVRRESERFVGRERELRLLERMLTGAGARVAFVYGPGGIGKSALLRELVRRARTLGHDVWLADGRRVGSATTAIENALGDARKARRPLVALDCFERMQGLEAYVRERLLAELPEDGAAVIVSRRPPAREWRDDGWEQVFAELPIGSLGRADASRALALRGISQEDVADRIVSWAGGHPLALALGAEAATFDPAWDPGAGLATEEVRAPLIARLAHRDFEGPHRKTLAVAAVAHEVAAPLLEAVLGELEPEVELGWLASRDYVEPVGAGVALHDPLAEAIRAELTDRHPELERELRCRIADYLHASALRHGDLLPLLDLAHLIGDERVLWGFSAAAAATYRLDGTRPGDVEALDLRLRRSRHAAVWQGSRALFRRAPGLVCVARGQREEPMGYTIAATPARESAACAEDPILGPRLADARRIDHEGDSVVWRDSVDLTGDPAARMTGLLGVAGVLRSGAWNPRFGYVPINPALPGAGEFVAALGATHLRDLDVRLGPVEIQCHRVDWGPGGVLGRERELIYRGYGLKPPDGPIVSPALAAGVAEAASVLERRRELEEMEQILAAARRGRGGAILIEAGPGLGKTALLDCTRSLCDRIGLQTLTARGEELQRGLAHGIGVELLTPALKKASGRAELLAGAAGGARHLFEAEASPPLDGDDFGVVHGLYWVVSELAERHPLALLIDDAQWADAASQTFLRLLCGRLAELPVAVVLAARPSADGRDQWLREIAAAPAVLSLKPAPLSAAAVAELVRRSDPQAQPEFATACHRASGGNPLLLSQLLSSAREDGIPFTRRGADSIAALAPVALSRATMARLARLGPASVRIAEAAAIMGSRAKLSMVAEIAGLESHQAERAVEALAGAGILVRTDSVEVAHPAIAESVRKGMSDAARRRLHARCASALRERGVRGKRLVAHVLRASEGDAEPWHADVLLGAGRVAAARGDRARATRHSGEALKRATSAEQRSEALVQLGRLEAAAGEKGGAERFQSALELMREPDRRARVLAELGEALYGRSDYAGAARAFRDGYEELTAASRSGVLSAHLLAGFAVAARKAPEPPERGRELLERFEALAEDPPEHPDERERILLAHIAGARALSLEGSHLELARLARLALGELADGDAVPQVVLDPLGTALIVCGELEPARRLLDAAVARARSGGSVTGYASLAGMRAWCLERQGLLSAAVAEAESVLTVADGLGDASHALIAARGVMVSAQLERDDTQGAGDAADPGESERAWAGSPFVPFFLERRARLRLATGNAHAARADLDRCAAAGPRASRNPAHVPWRSTAALAAFRSGDRAAAGRYADEELDLARGFGEPLALGIAMRVRGLVTGGEDGLEALHEAVRLLGRSGSPVEHAHGVIALGSALRRQGRRRDARVRLRAGLDQASGCGARRLVRQAHEELEASGARLVRAPLRGIESLTPSEMRVATLAAAGHSNKQVAQELFISLRTVETHLTHTYAKLGLDSRSQLADAIEGAR